MASRRTHRRTDPIIAVIANATSGARELCMAVGTDDYIAKPLRTEKLAERSQWLKLADTPRHSKLRRVTIFT